MEFKDHKIKICSCFSKIISPHCAPDDDERQGTTEWIGLIGSNNRQEIRPLPCSFALLIASTRTLIADGKNASDQLQISLSLWYNYTFLARCGTRRGIAIARAPGCVAWLVHTQCKSILVWFPIWSCAFVWQNSKVHIHCACPNVPTKVNISYSQWTKFKNIIRKIFTFGHWNESF